MTTASEHLQLRAARAGDQHQFSRLSEPYRGELLVHCYRMLGSLQDAEDMVQEAMLRAWRRLETYAGRSTFRAWLYKIATNACLDTLRKRPRRNLPPNTGPAADPALPFAAPNPEPVWIDPLPEEMLSGFASGEGSPEARYSLQESVTLAFLVALQVLPPRQRAVLLLRDVLAWRARETAELLNMTVSAVNSALFRARTTLAASYQAGVPESLGIAPQDAGTRNLLDQYLRAWEAANVDELVGLLREDAVFAMPPVPSWYQGRAAIRTCIQNQLFAGDARGRWRLFPVQANAQPAFAFYRRDDTSGRYHAFGIHVLTLAGGRVAGMTHFFMDGLLPRFGFSAVLGE